MTYPQAIVEYCDYANVWMRVCETLGSRLLRKAMLDCDAIHTAFSRPNTLIQESVLTFYTGRRNELASIRSVFGRPDLTNCRSEA